MRPLLPTEWIDPQSSGLYAAASLTASDVVDRPHELPPPNVELKIVDGSASIPLRRALEHAGRLVMTLPAPTAEEGEEEAPVVEPVTPPAVDEGNPRYRLWRPNAWLESVVADLPPGRALDLGCGTGRDAVWLAARGWTVTAIDRLPDAIGRGRELEVRYSDGPEIDWHIGRIEDLDVEGPFDLVWCGFAPWRLAGARLFPWLSPTGMVMVETFTEVHLKETGRPKDRAMRVSRADAKGIGAESYEESWRDDRSAHTGRMLVRNEPEA